MIDAVKWYFHEMALNHIASARKANNDLYQALVDIAEWRSYQKFIQLVKSGNVPDELLATLILDK